MKKRKKRGSIIFQVGIMFFVCILLTGGITFVSQLVRSSNDVERQLRELSESITNEVKLSVLEYPAYEWLLRYWTEHADELEIEYDAGFERGTQTEQQMPAMNTRQ